MPSGTKADTSPSNAASAGGPAGRPSGTLSGSAPGAGAVPGPGKEQRVTKQRLAVSAALDELDDFVSTQELYRILQNQGVSVSLATAYRILQSLAEDGLVDVLRNGEGEAVYRRCAVTGHHHHLLCRNCGKAVEVEAPAVETWAARIAQEHGYTEVAHTVEIFGLCPDCTALRAAGKL
jgi:Fur family ferric uptake transcriptional regulator